MARLVKRIGIGLLVLALAATPLRAQLWYNGGWNGSTTLLPSQRNLFIPDSRIYDDFLVTGSGWNVTSLFADFLSGMNPTQAYWEIRQGLSTANGGTLLFSGTSAIEWDLLGAGALGEQEYRATIDGLSLLLLPGTYWITIAPLEDSYAWAHLARTSGAGGVNPLLDGNSYWDSSTLGKVYLPAAAYFGRNTDFSYGVEGTVLTSIVEQTVTVTPEPGTLFLLGSGLGGVGLGVLLRRKRARSS